MTRSALMLCVLCSAACDRPEARDKATVFFSLEQADGGAVAGIQMRASADDQVREMDAFLDITLSGVFAEGSTPQVEMFALEGLSEVGSAGMVDGTSSIQLTPDLRACDGAAYAIREDGGCDYVLNVIVIGDQAYTLFGNFDLKAQADEDWSGDPDSVELIVEASVAETSE